MIYFTHIGSCHYLAHFNRTSFDSLFPSDWNGFFYCRYLSSCSNFDIFWLAWAKVLSQTYCTFISRFICALTLSNNLLYAELDILALNISNNIFDSKRIFIWFTSFSVEKNCMKQWTTWLLVHRNVYVKWRKLSIIIWWPFRI